MNQKSIEDYFTACKEKMVHDICELIKIDSVKSEAEPGMPFGRMNAEVLELAMKLAVEKGFEVKNYDNYVATVRINQKTPKLDILAHLDVVPANEAEWTVTKPFVPIVQEGKIFGRGSADDKGPVIAVLYAMKAISDLGIPLKDGVCLILGTDEESGSKDIEYYYSIEEPSPMTFSPDSDFPVINCEKGGYWSAFTGEFNNESTEPRILNFKGGDRGNTVPAVAQAEVVGITLDEVERCCSKTEEKTGICFKCIETGSSVVIEASGLAAHASTPEKGNNAITGLLEVLEMINFKCIGGTKAIQKLSKIFPHGDYIGKAAGVEMDDEESGSLTLSLNILEYDGNVISGRIDCRTPVCATDENVVRVLKSVFQECGIVLIENRLVPAHFVPPDSEFVQQLLKCYEQYTGNKGYCISTGGMTYTHHVENGVAFGCVFPGGDNHMHGADEFVVIDDLITSAKIFTQVIINLCGE